MIVMMDDIGRAFYRKLKAESDNLSRIQVAIKYKRKQVEQLFDEWIELESLDLDDDADSVYRTKMVVEREVAGLELEERESLRKIHAYTQARSA